MKLSPRVATAAMLLGSLACSEATGPTLAASVSVTAPDSILASGGSLQLAGTVLDSRGGLLEGRPINWSSSNAAVATASTSGLVTAGRVLGSSDGVATIAATSGTASGSKTIFVRPLPVSFVAVTPAAVSVPVGASQQLNATLLGVGGEVLTGRNVIWTSSNPAVVAVSASGLVTTTAYTGAETRTATITATSEGQVGAVSLTVTPAPVTAVIVSPTTATLAVGGAQQLTATTLGAGSISLNGRTVSWSSSNLAVATVSASGLVTTTAYTGAETRSATITATSEGQVGAVNLTVSPAPVAAVTVVPASATLAVGATQQLTATPLGSGGAALAGRTITWSSSDDAVATVSSSGLVTPTFYAGSATRSATISAASEGQVGSVSLSVTPAPVTAVTITPVSPTLAVGAAQQMTVTALGAGGVTLTGRAVTWSSSNPGVATVTTSGLVTPTAYTGGETRTATITATIEGQTSSVMLTVTPAPVTSVSVSPSTSTLIVGETTQLTATAFGTGGVMLTGRTVTWNSSNLAVASVSSNGLVSTLAMGSAVITATIGSVGGTASVAAISDVIAYYPLDGDGADASGNGKHADAISTTPTTNRNGQSGLALAFNGTTSRVVSRDFIFDQAMPQYSISLWFRPTAGLARKSGGYTIAGLVPHWSLGLSYRHEMCATELCVYVGDGTGWKYFTNAPVAPGNLGGAWHHLAFVVNGTSHQLYVDGSLLWQGTSSGRGTSKLFKFIIGAIFDAAGGEIFHGSLDDVLILRRALSATEVVGLATP